MPTFVYVAQDDDRIAIFRLDRDTGNLSPAGRVAAGRHPSFLAFAPSKRFVYAVNELSNEVASFAIDPATGALSFLNRVPSGGVEPAFLSLDAGGRWLFAANYRTGPVVVFRIAQGGRIGALTESRATGVHPHAILLDPGNQFALVPNIGSDTLSVLRFDRENGTLELAHADVATRPKAEPRHLAWHPEKPFVYVIEEAGSEVEAYSKDPESGALTSIGCFPTLPPGADPAGNTGSDIHLSSSGKFLYGSNRGHDSIVIYAVENDGALTLVGHASTHGKTPRNFGLDPTGAFLFVANKDSGTVARFRIDSGTGALRHVGTTETGASPYWVGAIILP